MTEFEIDEGRLESEWVRQPSLVHKHCLELAGARLALNHAKNQLEALIKAIDADNPNPRKN